MIQVRDFYGVEAQPAVDGVTWRLVIGPDQGAPHFNLRVFDVQPGYATPYHSHWWEHEIFVLSGKGVIRTEQGDLPVRYGSTVFIPGGEMHQLQNTGDELLRFICLVPQDWLQNVKQTGC